MDFPSLYFRHEYRSLPFSFWKGHVLLTAIVCSSLNSLFFPYFPFIRPSFFPPFPSFCISFIFPFLFLSSPFFLPPFLFFPYFQILSSPSFCHFTPIPLLLSLFSLSFFIHSFTSFLSLFSCSFSALLHPVQQCCNLTSNVSVCFSDLQRGGWRLYHSRLEVTVQRLLWRVPGQTGAKW